MCGHHAARRARHSRRGRFQAAHAPTNGSVSPPRFANAPCAIGIGAASVREIDRVNIYHATVIAMRRALSRLTAHAAPRADRRQADSHARGAAHGDRRWRRRVLHDRVRVDPREGDARSAHAKPRVRGIPTTDGSETSGTRRWRICRVSRRTASRRTIVVRSSPFGNSVWIFPGMERRRSTSQHSRR